LNKKHIYFSKVLDSNGNASYTDEENNTWAFLLNRQKDLTRTRASKEFIKGLEFLNFSQTIPQHYEVTSVLNKHTGWGVSPVPALIQPEQFFSLLAKKDFLRQISFVFLQKLTTFKSLMSFMNFLDTALF